MRPSATACSRPATDVDGRSVIGLWTELGPGSRWTNEGVSRVVGFLIEGAAQSRATTFHLVVPGGMGAVVRADLMSLKAEEGQDWVLHEGPTSPTGAEQRRAMEMLADFANATVGVEGWVVTFPFFLAARRLAKPIAVLFPDAIPYDFPWGWPGEVHWGAQGHWPQWFRATSELLTKAPAVITFSKHVDERHVQALFGVAGEKVRVVPLAAPDLSHLLPDREGRISRSISGERLRAHARDRGWRYLGDFPFEETPYVVVSTQDRPTKNICMAALAVINLIRKRHVQIKMVTTATIHYGADWTDLPGSIETRQAQSDILSMPDLPRDVHAALYHCAAATLHPSFYEGIVGALPLFESLSVGTPALAARGPHTDELLQEHPGLEPWLFDPYDGGALEALMLEAMAGRDRIAAVQQELYAGFARRSWGDVAKEYALVATSGVGDDNARGRPDPSSEAP